MKCLAGSPQGSLPGAKSVSAISFQANEHRSGNPLPEGEGVDRPLAAGFFCAATLAHKFADSL